MSDVSVFVQKATIINQCLNDLSDMRDNESLGEQESTLCTYEQKLGFSWEVDMKLREFVFRPFQGSMIDNAEVAMLKAFTEVEELKIIATDEFSRFANEYDLLTIPSADEDFHVAAVLNYGIPCVNKIIDFFIIK